MLQELKDRLYSKVSVDGDCWEWQFSLSQGYGHFTFIDNFRVFTRIGAHRLAYMLEFGSIPQGLFICHHCDNRKCVRPSHLFAGTCKENVHDALNKNRPIGRPIATNPKVARIQICLTLDELATITEAAGNVRVSEWARRTITAACQK
jgi:hypothetical protein